MQLLPSILLCGYERGGTTLLSEIFRRNGYQSGFEVGVLMCDTPSSFHNYQPYNQNLLSSWKIQKHVLSKICDTQDFADFYHNLFSFSGIIDCENIEPHHSDKLFDKTPIYMSKLGSCLHKTHFNNKAVVIYRDPRAVMMSWAKRRNTSSMDVNEYIIKNIRQLAQRYCSYFIGSITHRKNPNVLFISFEQLCLKIEDHLKIIGQFSEGQAWENGASKSRYANVTSHHIDQGKVLEYKHYLKQETQDIILDSTKLASWFFHDASDCIHYGEHWSSISANIKEILKKNNITQISYDIDGAYFEPETYLLRYPDLIRAGINPLKHFQKNGKSEKRTPC